MPRLAQMMADAAVAALRAMPPRWRERLKGLVGALGHEPGWAHRLRARRLARTTKRLDRLAGAVARRLAAAGVTRLTGAACLEFGSGHLLSEALLYHLAGARRVVAVDYFPLLQESELRRVCDGVEAELIVAALAPFDTADAVRRRLEALLARAGWSLLVLADLGVTYAAPYDAAKAPFEQGAFDLVASASVLEHVPSGHAPAILTNLFAALAPGGTMVHYIHLEDHRDFDRAPFAFLAAGTDWTEADSDRRGNRLRASEWEGFARALPGATVTLNDRIVRPEARLPDPIDPRLAQHHPADLAVSGLVLAVRKDG